MGVSTVEIAALRRRGGAARALESDMEYFLSKTSFSRLILDFRGLTRIYMVNE
jgi:hypothetical protein